MSIYTKKGDMGKSSIIGKTNILKSSFLLEAIGSLDELNSFLGLTISHLHRTKEKKNLERIQSTIFILGALLSNTKENRNYKAVVEKETIWLEKKIDKLENSLEPLQNFILPGGSNTASLLHVTRTVTRRCERNLVKAKAPYYVLPFINRLSDYFFVLARYLNKTAGVTESVWKL